MGSELCRSFERLNKPPRLPLPEVEVDVRVDCGIGGFGIESSPSEIIVEVLPRGGNPAGAAETDWARPDLPEAFESLRNTGEPGLARLSVVALIDEGDVGSRGERFRLRALSASDGRGTAAVSPPRLGESDGRPLVECLGVVALGAEFSGDILTGSGNSGPLFFFLRLGSLKNVVVVETVWVVVVVDANTPFSPKLPSDLEDSDTRDTGKARAEEDSSPYGGGATPPFLRDSSNVARAASKLFPPLLDSLFGPLDRKGILLNVCGGDSNCLPFLFPTRLSIVGAVVIMEGAGGIGGATNEAIFPAVLERFGSDACRNRSILKR